jgi:sarcosine oxidase
MTETLARADVAVIGLGAMGAMTAWQTAARGASVVGVERFPLAHARGSSHGGSRIFRLILFEGPEYVPLARASLELWRRLERESGTSLLAVSGGLVIGPADGPLIADARRSAEAAGVEHELLDADELRARYPQHAVFDDDVAVYEPGAGALAPEAAIRAAAGQAERAGARIFTELEVTALRLGAPEVRVVTERGTILARKVVLCTGAWFGDLAPSPALPVRIQRSCLTWFRGAEPAQFEPERFPVFVRESGELDGWGIPDVDGRGVKVGVGDSGSKPWLDRPEDNWTAPTAADIAPIEAFCRRAFPALAPTAADAAACMNAKTPDGHFIIGPASSAPQVIVVGGFSGHGFKHAAGVGRVAAELALDGGTDIPIERFSPDRFAAVA